MSKGESSYQIDRKSSEGVSHANLFTREEQSFLMRGGLMLGASFEHLLQSEVLL